MGIIISGVRQRRAKAQGKSDVGEEQAESPVRGASKSPSCVEWRGCWHNLNDVYLSRTNHSVLGGRLAFVHVSPHDATTGAS